MGKAERNSISDQIQKMLGEHYGTVGRSENHSIAEEIVRLFHQSDTSVDEVSDKPSFVYRLHEHGKCKTYEIGENNSPRTDPREWCDRRVCEGFWGNEEMCKRIVTILNDVYWD